MVSLTVMAITMTVLLKAAAGQQDQARYNRTVERVNMIKDAIVRVSSLNGMTAVNGFAVDMGRLPENLHELLEKDYCLSNIEDKNTMTCTDSVQLPQWKNQTLCADGKPPSTTTNTCLCADGTEPSGTSPDTAVCSSAGVPIIKTQITLAGGWNGPYLQTSQNPSHVDINHGSDALTDGWGNEGHNPPSWYPDASPSINPDPRHNYGWSFSNTYIDAHSITQPGVLIYSYGNGCFLDPTLCKGNTDVAELLDFTYPIPLLGINGGTALCYSDEGKAITPDPTVPISYTGTCLTSLPTIEPIITSSQWRIIIGDSNTTLGTGVDVSISGRGPCIAATSLPLNPFLCHTSYGIWEENPANICKFAGQTITFPAATNEQQCERLIGTVATSPANTCTLSLPIPASSPENCNTTLPTRPEGVWKPNSPKLCLSIYFIQNGMPTVISSDTTSGNADVIMSETGSPQTVHFTFPLPSGATQPVSLPAGNAAFSIHSGPCSSLVDASGADISPPPAPPNGTNTPTYPSPGRHPAPVKILPGQIPSFAW